MRAIALQVLLCRREGLHFMSVEMYARNVTGGGAGAARCPSRVDVERWCGAMPVAGRCSAKVGVSATRLTLSPLLGDTQCSGGCGWERKCFYCSLTSAPEPQLQWLKRWRQWWDAKCGRIRNWDYFAVKDAQRRAVGDIEKGSRRHWKGFRG